MLVASLEEWFLRLGGSPETWDDDERSMRWILSHQTQLTQFKSQQKKIALAERLAQTLRDTVAAYTATIDGDGDGDSDGEYNGLALSDAGLNEWVGDVVQEAVRALPTNAQRVVGSHLH